MTEHVGFLEQLPARAVLDGELVAFGEDGKPDFERVRENSNPQRRSRLVVPRLPFPGGAGLAQTKPRTHLRVQRAAQARVPRGSLAGDAALRRLRQADDEAPGINKEREAKGQPCHVRVMRRGTPRLALPKQHCP